MAALDFKQPDYTAELTRRLELLRKIRAEPEHVEALKAYYRHHPWQFVADWGVTYDPRNIERGLPAIFPVVPFPKQIELMQRILGWWHAGEDGLVPKSRDVGASWVAVALSCTLCLLHNGMAVGFGSRKEEYVDRLDSPKSLFYKARVFLDHLPVEFRGGWRRDKHGAYMRLTFPGTGSVMTGEAGDNIGRGDRTAIYFVDESAHLERPQRAEESLSATTNCRIDMSSVNGPATPFSVKRRTWPEHRVFTFGWWDDPRKDAEWRRKLEATKDPSVIAQEYDLDENASVTGVVIQPTWARAAVGAHIKLGIEVAGERFGGLDVADEGPDKNAMAARYGILLNYLEAWSGAGSDIYDTTERALGIADMLGLAAFAYDGDGLGAGVRGDARKIKEATGSRVEVEKFQGSGSVIDPDAKIPQFDGDESRDPLERTNKDYFANRKAQGWWDLRLRFMRTYRAVALGHKIEDPSLLISIDPNLPNLEALLIELSQATYTKNKAGQLLINKMPEGARSPNLADAVKICYAPRVPKRRSFFDLEP